MLSTAMNCNTYTAQSFQKTYPRKNSKESASTNFTTDSADSALTEEELRLAKQYKEFINYGDLFMSALKKGEYSDQLHELTRLNKQTDMFGDVIKKIGVVVDSTELFVDITKRPAYNLPKQGFSLSRSENSFSFGIGSTITVGDYYLRVLDNAVGSYPLGFEANPQSDIKILSVADTKPHGNEGRALDEIIHAVTSGSANWGNNMEMNGEILSFLNKIGIDTSKDFKINGVAFEVKSGVVQTKSYSSPTQEASGHSYLNSLLARAYEQHLL